MKKLFVYLFFLVIGIQSTTAIELTTSTALSNNSGDKKILTDEDLKLITEVSSKIEFIHKSTKLTEESKEAMSKIVTLLSENPDFKLIISGHYFEKNSNKRNLKLSFLQGEAVKAYFTSVKIDESRIKVNGFGDLFPLSITKPEANTRIDLSINY